MAMITFRAVTALICLSVLSAASGEQSSAQAQTDRLRTKPATLAIRHGISRPSRTIRRHLRRTRIASYSDTFLPAASATREQLLGQISGNSRTIKYYSKYLNIAPANVIASLSDGLALTTLKAAGSFTEYRRHSNGVIYPVRVELPRGTQVFKTMGGKVSLLAANGDPIVPYAMVVNIIRKPAPIKKAPPVEVIVTAPEREVVDQGKKSLSADGAHP